MFKMGFHVPFVPKNKSYGQKKGGDSNCQFDSRPLKVRNRLDLLACNHVQNIVKFFLTKVKTLFQTSPQSKVYTKSYGPSKSPESQFRNLGIFNLGVPRQNLGVGLVARHKGYYKGEGGGFPQVWVVVSFVNLCLLVVCPCTKSAPIMH